MCYYCSHSVKTCLCVETKHRRCFKGQPFQRLPLTFTLLDIKHHHYWSFKMAVKQCRKKDNTITVKSDNGKILTNLPSEENLAAAKQSLLQLRTDAPVVVEPSEETVEALNTSIDSLVLLGERIDELEDARLSLRLQADSENRPLNEEEILQVKQINEKLNIVRSHRKKLINQNKDIRVEKAEYDVAEYEKEIEEDNQNGTQRVLMFEEKVLGEAEAVGFYDSNTQEWHNQRKRFVGGSDVSSIMGTSNFSNYNKLLATKLGLISNSSAKPFAATLGDTYEPLIQHEFAKKHGPGSKEPYTVYHTKSSWVNKTNQYHGANVDGLYDSTGTGSTPDGILEIKAVSNLAPWADGPPIYYRQQVLWYMHATGLRKGKIVALFNQEEYNEYDITPEEGEIENIVEKVSEFEEHLAKERKKLERMNTTKLSK